MFALAPALMFGVAPVAALRPALLAAGVDPMRGAIRAAVLASEPNFQAAGLV